jgi:maleate isomerase
MAEGGAAARRRAKIGLLYLSDGDLDAEFWQLVPSYVTVHITRTWVPEGPLTIQAHQALAESGDIEESARRLAVIRPDVIVYADTSITFFRGPDYDEEIARRMQEATEIPATTTSTAVVRALKTLGVERVTVLAPYLDEVSERLRLFLEGNGLQVVGYRSLNLGMGLDIGALSSSRVFELAREADVPRSQGLFISCTALSTVDIIESLESDLGKPVVTSNQATMWRALRMAGIEDRLPGLGTLYLR